MRKIKPSFIKANLGHEVVEVEIVPNDDYPVKEGLNFFDNALSRFPSVSAPPASACLYSSTTKFAEWTYSGGSQRALSKDERLGGVGLYRVTNIAGSSSRTYWGTRSSDSR